jgi:hypothetical protein
MRDVVATCDRVEVVVRLLTEVVDRVAHPAGRGMPTGTAQGLVARGGLVADGVMLGVELDDELVDDVLEPESTLEGAEGAAPLSPVFPSVAPEVVAADLLVPEDKPSFAAAEPEAEDPPPSPLEESDRPAFVAP